MNDYRLMLIQNSTFRKKCLVIEKDYANDL